MEREEVEPIKRSNQQTRLIFERVSSVVGFVRCGEGQPRHVTPGGRMPSLFYSADQQKEARVVSFFHYLSEVV